MTAVELEKGIEMNDRVLAGIVTYEPDIGRLKQNIEAILANGIGSIVIVDNGSSNADQILALQYPDIQFKVIRNAKNLGITKALNQIFERAEQMNKEWVLTMDQDSVLLPNMLDTYAGHMNREDVASLTCLFCDRNYQSDFASEKENKWVTECFTSGNLVRTRSWKDIGGFNERLFIDLVDSDFCYRLGEKNLKILRINTVCMIHELGKATEKKILGRNFKIYNHSAFRKYYIGRNGMYCMRRFPKVARVGDRGYSFIPITLLKILFGETNKIKKTISFLHGLFDGIFMYNKIKSGETGCL